MLTSLIHLDLSGNKLRSLPAELGDMTHLKELLLNNNVLRVLPYELGKLFMLQVCVYVRVCMVCPQGLPYELGRFFMLQVRNLCVRSAL